MDLTVLIVIRIELFSATAMITMQQIRLLCHLEYLAIDLCILLNSFSKMHFDSCSWDEKWEIVSLFLSLTGRDSSIMAKFYKLHIAVTTSSTLQTSAFRYCNEIMKSIESAYEITTDKLITNNNQWFCLLV